MRKRFSDYVKLIVVLLFVTLLITSCAKFQVSKAELANLGPNEGIVVGSFAIEMPYTIDERELWYQKRVTNTKWKLSITRIKKNIFHTEIPSDIDYVTPVIVAGDKVFFVTKLPKGNYFINNFSHDNLNDPATIYFDVKNNQTTYIGELLIKIYGFRPHQTIITNTQNATIAHLKKEYGSILNDVTSNTMIKGSHRPFKKEYGKTPNEMKPEDYISIFQGTDDKKKKKTASYLTKNKIFDSQVLDVVENKILEGFNNNLEDKLHVEVISWLCVFLGRSGDAKYLPTFKRVENEATNKLIKWNAARYLKDKN